MIREDFEQLVSLAIDALSEQFLSKLDNVDVVVELWASPDQLSSVGFGRPEHLFGLYQGIPQTKRRGSFQLPDKISIFAGPILSKTSDPAQIQQMVENVVKHEIAHHFGMDEHAIRKRGY